MAFETERAAGAAKGQVGCDCGASPRLELRGVKREIRGHLARLKRRWVRKALARSDDPALRASLRETNRASHAQKKAALRAIPNHARLCDA